MAYKWSEQLIEDNYCKYECLRCDKAFIVGEELSSDCSMVCPYCHSEKIECMGVMDEEYIETSGGFGCAGIYIRNGNKCDKLNCYYNDEGYCDKVNPNFDTKECFEISE